MVVMYGTSKTFTMKKCVNFFLCLFYDHVSVVVSDLEVELVT